VHDLTLEREKVEAVRAHPVPPPPAVGDEFKPKLSLYVCASHDVVSYVVVAVSLTWWSGSPRQCGGMLVSLVTQLAVSLDSHNEVLRA